MKYILLLFFFFSASLDANIRCTNIMVSNSVLLKQMQELAGYRDVVNVQLTNLEALFLSKNHQILAATTPEEFKRLQKEFNVILDKEHDWILAEQKISEQMQKTYDAGEELSAEFERLSCNETNVTHDNVINSCNMLDKDTISTICIKAMINN